MVENELRGPEARASALSARPAFGAVCQGQDCSLIAEADHRIANHLAMLASHLRLQAAEVARQQVEPSRASVQLLLLGLEAQISSVARLHRQLSGGSRRAPADLADELHEVCSSFQSGLAGSVTVIEDFERGCFVQAAEILPLAQIFTEVITNAVKHAYPNDHRGVVIARLRKNGPDLAEVEIVDHGPGFSRPLSSATAGLGFRVVRALAGQLHATAHFNSTGEGVRFKLTLPISRRTA